MELSLHPRERAERGAGTHQAPGEYIVLSRVLNSREFTRLGTLSTYLHLGQARCDLDTALWKWSTDQRPAGPGDERIRSAARARARCMGAIARSAQAGCMRMLLAGRAS